MEGKREHQMKKITERLEQGVEELFTSEKYTEYLKTMSKFHHYSFNNTLLIAMQKPDATLVAGYQAWQKKFKRQVKRGEKGIQIIAPVPVRQKEEVEKFDPETNELILRSDGQPETEEVERSIPRFRLTTVFDLSQTEGEPLSQMETPELMGSVENFQNFMQAIKEVSPVPIRFDEIESGAKGYYSNTDKEIVIQSRLSESQTMKTAVHETAHAKLHDRDFMEEQREKKNKMEIEVEAESIAFTVCQYFGLDTSDYSFPYIAGWSSSMDMQELRTSMELIRRTAGELIDGMMEVMQRLMREHPEKEHLEESDLILQLNLPSDEGISYFVIENMEKPQLLAEMNSYHDLFGKNRETSIDEFLQAQGATLIPWYDTAGLMVEHPVNFYDVAYDYDNGVSDAAQLSAMAQAELLINRMEYGEAIFNEEDRNLIMNYAFKFDDVKDTKALIWELKEAMEAPGGWEYLEVRENALAEIASLPDAGIGLSEMHQAGYYDAAILPLNLGRAIELHQAGENIYSLHTDGSRTLMNTEQDILENGGMFGIEARAWERYRVLEKVDNERKAEKEKGVHQESGHHQEELFLNSTGEDTYRTSELPAGARVTEYTSGLEVDGHTGGWHTKEVREYGGKSFYLMESDQYMDSVAGIIVNADGEVVAEDLWNGFDRGAMEAIKEYFEEAGVEWEPEQTETFMETVPGQKSYPSVYYHSFSYAMEHAAADDYLDSRRLNIACKNAVEDSIRTHFDGFHLAHDVVQPVLEEYGKGRLAFVLACTVQNNLSDGRFSRENKAWAESIFIPENISRGINANLEYVVDSHPAVLDGFIRIARERFTESEKEHEPEKIKPFIARYYVVNDAYGLKAEREYQYFPDLDSAITAYAKFPNHLDKEIGMESTEQPPSRMNLLTCRNGIETVEDIGTASLSGKWVNPESREARQRAEEYLEKHDTEIAYHLESAGRYFTIQTVSEGYDYTFYDQDLREIDGGIYDNLDITLQEAMRDILEDEGIPVTECKVTDYDELQEKIQQKENDTLLTAESELEMLKNLPLISDMTEPEKALGGLSRAEIEEMVLCYAQVQLDEMGLTEEVKLIGARVYGSRTREGFYHEDSDVDVVLSYSGNIREDVFFNMLHDDGMEMAGLPLDINPVSVESTCTLKEYMEKAEGYLDNKVLKEAEQPQSQRKQSVLKALRERQAKLKGQEQKSTNQETQKHGKGEQEL